MPDTLRSVESQTQNNITEEKSQLPSTATKPQASQHHALSPWTFILAFHRNHHSFYYHYGRLDTSACHACGIDYTSDHVRRHAVFDGC